MMAHTLLCVFGLVIVIACVHGECPKCHYVTHPQIQYCNAQYVLKIKVTKQTGSSYEVQVMDVFKGETKVGDILTIYTDCNYYFEKSLMRWPFFVTIKNSKDDGKVVMDGCDFVKAGKYLECYNRRGLTDLYYRYTCDCVNSGDTRCNNPDPSTVECFQKWAMCHKRPNNKCGKIYHFEYENCVAKSKTTYG